MVVTVDRDTLDGMRKHGTDGGAAAVGSAAAVPLSPRNGGVPEAAPVTAAAAAAWKGARWAAADARLGLRKSSLRERLFTLVFLLVPFVVGFLFVLQVQRRDRARSGNPPSASGASSASPLGASRDVGSVDVLDNTRASTGFAEDFSANLEVEKYKERKFRQDISTSGTIGSIRKARMERLYRKRNKILTGEAGNVTAPHVSLVAGCRDRSSFLLQSLGTWLNALDDDDELILVDWSTNERLLSVPAVAELTNDDRVTTISVKDQDDWVLSRAYNLAAKFASGLNLLKVDCDTMLEPDFFDAHPLDAEAGESIFFKTSWRAARTENEVHLNGVFYVKRSKFLEIHGYDERITTYGWDDTDLYTRLERAGLKQRIMNFNKLHHIAHGDDAREANQLGVDSPMLETQANDLAIHWLLPVAESYHFVGQACDFRVLAFSFKLVR
ncbi:hypothetical protein FVE85_4000 [Porphyridium purpureum]|uniref:Galactosyltransferase C-terminal domain-containing protein n=1 Tax=Porphyridium purpureum TaxID=35688 RepID=A0A5J4YS08_PORPP|nr:hypothetical protein FVE85_4000 [Porphyridium purpureum]|eukprot:POR5485..scf229_5